MIAIPTDFTLHVEKAGELWTVTSLELPGLLVAEHDPFRAIAAAPEAIRDLMRAAAH